MAHEYRIRTVQGEMINAEPTVDKWYADASVLDNGIDIKYGALGCYAGEGVFLDRDYASGEWFKVDMREGEYLQEQV